MFTPDIKFLISSPNLSTSSVADGSAVGWWEAGSWVRSASPSAPDQQVFLMVKMGWPQPLTHHFFFIPYTTEVHWGPLGPPAAVGWGSAPFFSLLLPPFLLHMAALEAGRGK